MIASPCKSHTNTRLSVSKSIIECAYRIASIAAVLRQLTISFVSFVIFHSCSIYAQKVADQFANPEMTAFRGMDEPRLMDRPMYGAIHADLKHLDAGTCSTFMAANYYEDLAKKRRDELLAKYATEKADE
jgi:hypothetical protein